MDVLETRCADNSPRLWANRSFSRKSGKCNPRAGKFRRKWVRADFGGQGWGLGFQSSRRNWAEQRKCLETSGFGEYNRRRAGIYPKEGIVRLGMDTGDVRCFGAVSMEKREIFLAAGAIAVAAVALVYSNTFGVPFLFDDRPSPTTRPFGSFGPWGRCCCRRAISAVQRRPVVNVSLAINYAISGENVWSYHALNLAAHVLAAWLLFGIVRRTLLLPGMGVGLRRAAMPLAAAVALLWAVHPLLTEAVTYIVQRTEVLAGLFYLLTLYCVIRGVSARRPAPWYVAGVAACTLAMGSKEAAVSAPLVVLLYDRVFLSKSWREVLRRRWGLYAGLAATWTLVLVMLPYGEEGTAVFGRQGQAFEYALAQCGAIAHYLRLCFWPHPLLLDYGPYEPQRIGQAIPFVLLIGGLLLATAMAFRWQPWLGFLGVWFFAILAPSSSIVPLFQQIVAEKRMYLPLAAVVTGVVIGVFLAGQWLVGRRGDCRSALPAVGGSLVALVGLALGNLAFQRNADYHSDLSIWQDTVNKFPANARAHGNFGAALFSRGQIDEAIARYQEALAIKPDHFGGPQQPG